MSGIFPPPPPIFIPDPSIPAPKAIQSEGPPIRFCNHRCPRGHHSNHDATQPCLSWVCKHPDCK